MIYSIMKSDGGVPLIQKLYSKIKSQGLKPKTKAVSRQLSGDDTPVETTDLNTSDMGTMGAGMGKRFENKDRDRKLFHY